MAGSNGWLMGDPNTICRSVAGRHGRWLTANFRAGDVLIFTMYTVHASLDNCSPDRIRFSSDSRYQRADEPADDAGLAKIRSVTVTQANAARSADPPCSKNSHGMRIESPESILSPWVCNLWPLYDLFVNTDD